MCHRRRKQVRLRMSADQPQRPAKLKVEEERWGITIRAHAGVALIVRGVYYGDDDPDFGLGSELEFISEHKIGLDQIVSQEKEKLIYEYDFGDGWEHQIVVEKILQPESTRSYPNCLTGKRACPPEDVGGVWGYDNFVEIIRDKKHPEHKAMLEWVGGDFDPEEFNLEAVNETLKNFQ